MIGAVAPGLGLQRARPLEEITGMRRGISETRDLFWLHIRTMWNICILTWVVMTVEFMVALNPTDAVNDLTMSGQLLAFSVSLGGVLTLVFDWREL